MTKQDIQKTAKFVCDLKGWNGYARLYRLQPRFEFTDYDDTTIKVEHVVVSAIVAPFSGAETYIFKCNKHGENVQFSELPGSFRGALDHEAALDGMGYQVVLGTTPDIERPEEKRDA